MPLYFFDLHNDVDAPDPERKEFLTLDAAKANAVKEAREMMQESVSKGRLDLHHYIQVRDANGSIVFKVLFEDALVVRRGTDLIDRASASA